MSETTPRASISDSERAIDQHPTRRRTDTVALRSRLETDEVFTRLVRELRTLVSSSQQCVRLADADDVTDAQRHHYHQMSVDRLTELDDLVSVMHDLSLVDAGNGLNVSFERADLDRMAVDVAHELESAAEAREIDLQWRFSPDLPALLADVGGLQRALAAIVGNAIKYTGDGGRVRVAGELDAPSGRVRVTVTDEGPGIDEDESESIFEPFVQGRSGLESAVRGSGLGLTIARAIVHRNGGDMGLRNHGNGTTFWMTLPLLDAREVDRLVIGPALDFADEDKTYSVIVLGVQLNPEAVRVAGPNWAADIQARLRRTDRVLAMDAGVAVVVAVSNSPAAPILGERVEGALREKGLSREQHWIEPLTYPSTGMDRQSFRARARRMVERCSEERAA